MEGGVVGFPDALGEGVGGATDQLGRQRRKDGKEDVRDLLLSCFLGFSVGVEFGEVLDGFGDDAVSRSLLSASMPDLLRMEHIQRRKDRV